MTNLPAGRELDALVAEKVFGVPHGDCFDTYGGKRCVKHDEYGGPQCYSTDIAAAWEVVEKLIALGYWFDVAWNGESAQVDLDCKVPTRMGWDRVVDGLTASTVPLAICRAALRAVAP